MTYKEKEEYWTNIIKKCSESGDKVENWCRSNHIASSTYYKWRRRLYPSQSSFQEVTIVKPAYDNVSIRINGMTLDFDKSLLSDVIGSIK